MLPTHILRRRPHSRLHRLPRSIHKKLRKPFKHLLDLLRVRSLKILGGELHADITDTSCDFAVRLIFIIIIISFSKFYLRLIRGGGAHLSYQAHKGIAVILLLLDSTSIIVVVDGLGAELLAHAREVHDYLLWCFCANGVVSCGRKGWGAYG